MYSTDLVIPVHVAAEHERGWEEWCLVSSNIWRESTLWNCLWFIWIVRSICATHGRGAVCTMMWLLLGRFQTACFKAARVAGTVALVWASLSLNAMNMYLIFHRVEYRAEGNVNVAAVCIAFQRLTTFLNESIHILLLQMWVKRYFLELHATVAQVQAGGLKLHKHSYFSLCHFFKKK